MATDRDEPAGGVVTAPLWRRRLPMLLITVAAAALAGAAFRRLGVPLPWVLGPLTICAAGSIMGLDLRPVPLGRELGQVVIGLVIGLRFTPPVLAATLALLPAMVVATVYVVIVTTIAAFMLRRLARVDRKTAFFATAAAGMADMAIVARERGGDANAVSVVHAIRVAAVVMAVPLLVTAFGEEGSVFEPPSGATGDPLQLVLLLALGTGAALLVGRLPFPNPWLVGPIFLAAVLASAGLLLVLVPQPLLILAQIMVGIALGCRFRRELLLQLPRVVGAALVVTAFLILAAALAAAVLAAWAAIPFATAFLAVAPAGVTEMVITANAMHLDATVVTAFHVMRIAVIAGTIGVTFAIFERISRRLDASGT
ncbi:MAG TPA: AbrB family transcriptional regulator [Geminicoccaceae bacterium]|nr:AbrB family transcriptional regulator [Geminicoccaceae bacterium]